MIDDPKKPGDEPTLTSHGVPAPTTSTGPLPAAIGKYRVLGVLGEGGMGIVFEAEQDKPRRNVALKVMRGGHTVDEFHTKMFQREAETLARLDHPNIGAIYEAGHTDDGQDYFAMELVRGDTLDRFVSKRTGPLDAAELSFRLRLLRQICDAVHYAHQRGVIHRDLKPSNIIVADATESSSLSSSGLAALPQVKILDFGLARITDTDVQAATMMTEVGMIKGTLPYMSPEQARGQADAIDLRTDVYALGVIGYEMITGSRPYDVGNAALLEAIRVICEQPPLPLSQTLSGTRGIDPDVETILGKALAKEPDRRYTSAAALSDDVERYLTSQPIQARAPSAVYQMRKFAGRNKSLVVAAAVVLAALLLGLGGTAWGLRQAKQEARRSAQIAAFMQEMISGVDPAVAQGEDTTLLRRVLDETAARVENELAGQPDVAAALHGTIGQTYSALGDYAVASDYLSRSRATYREVFGEDDPRTLDAASHVAVHLAREGKAAEAEAAYLDTLARLERVLGDDHPEAHAVRSNLAVLYLGNGRADEAVPMLEQATAARRRLLGDDHRETLISLNSLGVALLTVNRFEEAETVLTEALERSRRVYGDNHPDTIKAMHNLAGVYLNTGRVEKAAALHEESVATFRKVFGDDHPDTLSAIHNLGDFYRTQNKLELAEAALVEALETRRERFGPEHPYTLASMMGLAKLRLAQRRPEDTERIFLEVLEIKRRTLGEEHAGTIDPLFNLAQLYRMWRRYEESRTLFEEVIALSRRVNGDDHPQTLLQLAELGQTLTALGEKEAAERAYRESLERRRRVFGDTHPHTLVTLNILGVHYMSLERYADAEPLLLEAMEGQIDTIGPDHPDTLITRFNLGWINAYSEDYDEAEVMFREAVEGFTRAYGPDHPHVRHVNSALAELHEMQGRLDDALRVQREVVGFSRASQDLNLLGKDLLALGGYLVAAGDPVAGEAAIREGIEVREEILAADDWRRPNAATILGAAIAAQGRYAEAEPLLVDNVETLLGTAQVTPKRRKAAVARVVKLYEDWGREEQAAQWREKPVGEPES